MTDRGGGLARFAHRIGNLKAIPRTGWLDRGIPPQTVESVADHSFRVATLAWLASSEVDGLDRDRVIRLALLHDLAEALTGDLTPYDPDAIAGLSPDELRETLNRRHVASPERKRAKQVAETAAIADLIAALSSGQRQEIDALWTELQARETPEARFVREIDILETFLQSREYLDIDPELPMESFAAEASREISTPFLQSLRDAITSQVRP